MKGIVLNYDEKNFIGIVRAETGERYEFHQLDWKSKGVPKSGMNVDFETSQNKFALEIYLTDKNSLAKEIYTDTKEYVAKNTNPFFTRIFQVIYPLYFIGIFMGFISKGRDISFSELDKMFGIDIKETSYYIAGKYYDSDTLIEFAAGSLITIAIIIILQYLILKTANPFEIYTDNTK